MNTRNIDMRTCLTPRTVERSVPGPEDARRAFQRCAWIASSIVLTTLGMSLPVFANPLTKADAPLTSLMASQSAGPTRPVPVILKFGGDLTPLRRADLSRLGVAVTRDLPIIHSVAARVPSNSLRFVAALPFVAHLSSDGMVKKCDAFTVGSSEAAVAIQKYSVSGAGIGVAVIDSGYVSSDDFDMSSGKSRVIDAQNFVSYESTTNDLCGHGTHVSGIIAGNGTDSGSHVSPYSLSILSMAQFSQTYDGIAPSASIISLRALDHEGESTVSTVVAAIQYAVTNKTKDNIRVINLSLGHPVGESYTADPLCQAVEAAWKAGIVVVCAAGNDGRLNATQTTGAANEGWGTAYGSIQCPGNDPYVITVGATKSMTGIRSGDRIATYSSRGPSRLDLVLKPDIIAPGNKVTSVEASGSYLQTTYESTNQVPLSAYVSNIPAAYASYISPMYFVLSGTSMAAPVVSGAAALMLSANPALTPDAVKARLMASADKWTDPSGNADPCTYGAGYLDIPAAMASTVTVTQAALSPTLYQDSSGNTYISTTVIGSRSIWGSAALTALRSIWGSTAIVSSSVNEVTSSRSIWGSSTVWTDRSIWGSSTADVDLSSVVLSGE